MEYDETDNTGNGGLRSERLDNNYIDIRHLLADCQGGSPGGLEHGQGNLPLEQCQMALRKHGMA